MPKNLLYIGNILSKHGSNLTSIEALGPLLEQNGFNVKYSSSQKNKLLRMLDMIVVTIRNLTKVDYVLIDTYSTQNFWYAFIVSQLCRIGKCKYIPILHGGYLPNRLAKNPHLSAMIFKNAFTNVAPSEYMQQQMYSLSYSNITVIPNHISLRQYNFKQRTSFNPSILWVRSFAEIYNPKMAIQVLAELKKFKSTAKLCMVGPDKGIQHQVQDLARSLNVDVIFKGKLSKREWIVLSEEYDFFINTSHTDNTPVSVIEAMALGLAVVSTNVGGIPFLIENNTTGVLVNDSDYQAMAQHIITLADNCELAQRITENARMKISSFDEKQVVNRWFSLLK